MEETKIEAEVGSNLEIKEPINKDTGQKQIAGSILIVGLMIAGAILLKGNTLPAPVQVANNGNPVEIPPITAKDRTIGNPNAKVTMVVYEDFQCPWCGKFENEAEQTIRKNYADSVLLVYRDFPFLGPESFRSAEAGMCANDQAKFWEYHDYLFTHQNGENKGVFADPNLKNFAKILGLDTLAFDQCLDAGKYVQTVLDEKAAGAAVGVRGTPKSFILKKGKVVDTVDGYMPTQEVLKKIDAALK